MSCVVWGCKSHSSRKENSQELLSFHRFPADADKKEEWLNRIGRRNWTPKKHNHICSKHFTKDSFVCATNNKWKRLREDAVPTLNITDQTDQSDSVLMDIKTEPSTSSHIHEHSYYSSQTTSNPNQGFAPMDFETVPNTSQISEPDHSCQTTSNQNEELLMMVTKTEEYKKKIHLLEKELERSKKVSKRRLCKINTLTKRVSRLSKKNEDLYSILIQKLKDENIETEYITMLDKINA